MKSDQPSMRRVLLVEDDDTLRSNYEMLLAAHRLDVRGCATKTEAQEAFRNELFDVIILDVTLGHDFEAGFELCQEFRSAQRITPIIFLTERADDHDRISGLRLGADDYLSKTISGSYLAARVTALIRRVEALTSGSPDVPAPKTSSSRSPLRIDEQLSCAYWDNTRLDLSLTQFWILKELFQNPGVVSSTADLMRAAKITVQPNTVVAHVKAIREKIQAIDPQFSAIKAERSRGYRWVEDS